MVQFKIDSAIRFEPIPVNNLAYESVLDWI